MATVVSQHVRHFRRTLGIFKRSVLIFAKLQQIFLNFVGNMCLQPKIRIQLRMEWKTITIF